MNKPVTANLLRNLCMMMLCCLPILGFGQQYLTLNYGCRKPVIAFSKVHTIDTRVMPQWLGFIQTGAFNKLTPLEFEGSFADSLAPFFSASDATVHRDEELVMILEELFLSEKTGGLSEHGNVKISARFFAGTGDGRYGELMTIDSVFQCSGMDVTQKMIRSVSEDFA